MQSRSGVRPVRTEARVGEQTVPAEWLSCIRIEPARVRHSSIRGVLAVPLFHLKSAHPMSSPRIIKNDGDGDRECGAAFPLTRAMHVSVETSMTGPWCLKSDIYIGPLLSQLWQRRCMRAAHATATPTATGTAIMMASLNNC